MITILLCVLSILIGGLIVFYYLRPQLKATQLLDKQTIEQNEEIAKKNKELIDENINLNSSFLELQQNLNVLKTKRQEVQDSIDILCSQAQQSADVFYKQSMENAKTKFDYDLELEQSKYDTAKQECENVYKETLFDCSEELSNLIESKKIELDKLDKEIQKHSREVEAAVEAARRAEEIRVKADFYKLVISQEDLEEIKILRSAGEHLRNKEPLNKIIWKCYYEKPTTDLIGRVIGSGVHTGIYKITNLENGMCYVGQATSLSDRWKQHIKRGLGAEPLTRNKLYPAMLSVGVENFSFEVIEECSREELDAREDYWQDYFKAKSFGYSIK